MSAAGLILLLFAYVVSEAAPREFRQSASWTWIDTLTIPPIIAGIVLLICGGIWGQS